MVALEVALFFVVVGAGACETFLTSADIAAGRGKEFLGGTSGEQLGFVVSAAGDVNGDGVADFALAAPYESPPFGAVYVVFGRNSSAWAGAQIDFSQSQTPDAASWIRISGATAGNYLGYYGVASGDFNRDGFSDLLIGSNGVSKAFCVFGHNTSWSSFDITSVGTSAIPGFGIVTSTSSSNVFVGNAGDLNGDGIEDLLVSDSNTYLAHVVFGVEGTSRSDFFISNINGDNGFSLTDASTNLGQGIMGSAGDVNGDGMADLVLGSFDADSDSGRAYIIFARNVSLTLSWPAQINLNSWITGGNGFIVKGYTNSQLGYTAVGAGDVNGDGFADIFIGSGTNGDAWVVFGRSASWESPLSVSQLNGTKGFHFADPSLENWGISGGAAGDVNGDGFDDIIIGGRSAKNSLDLPSGVAAILFGHDGTWPATLDRNGAKGTVGFMIDGQSSGYFFGHSSRGVGDVNGDGLADVVAGAPNSYSYAGSAVLVFGVADDHCAVCSNITDACIVCDDGFFLNGTLCEKTEAHFSSSALATAVVVIETGGGCSAIEVEAEIAQLLGVDVGQISVVEITPGTFEVTVINVKVAQQLVTLIIQCIN